MTSSISEKHRFMPISMFSDHEGPIKEDASTSMSRIQTIIEEQTDNSSSVNTPREEVELATVIACYCRQSFVFNHLPNSALANKGQQTVIELYDNENQRSCLKSTITPGVFKVKGQVRTQTNPDRKSPYAKGFKVIRAERGATPTCCKASQPSFYGGGYFP